MPRKLRGAGNLHAQQDRGMFAGVDSSSWPAVALSSPAEGGSGPFRVSGPGYSMPKRSARPQLRCTAPHPRTAGRCGAVIAFAQVDTVEVQQSEETRPGCVTLECRRCGTAYLICPLGRDQAA